jgi:hypothetical protein
VYVPAVVVEAGIEMLLPTVVVTVWLLPLLILYVNVYGDVPPAPVNVTYGDVPSLHTAVVPTITAVGNGLIVI